MTKVLITIPSGDIVHADFAMALAAMMAMPYKGLQVGIFNAKGCSIDRNRYRCVEAALDLQADYMLFIDTDMVFQSDLLIRLLDHRQAVVAVDAVKRVEPYEKVARDLRGRPIDSGRGLVGASYLGTGIMLIDMDVFKSLAAPYFYHQYNGEGCFVTEDIGFCDRVRARGIKIYCDTNIQVGHIGTEARWVA